MGRKDGSLFCKNLSLLLAFLTLNLECGPVQPPWFKDKADPLVLDMGVEGHGSAKVYQTAGHML